MRLTAAAVWTIAVAIALWLIASSQHPESTWWLSNWAAVPGQLACTLMVAQKLRRPTSSGVRRAAWWLVLAFVVVNALANVIWNTSWVSPRPPSVTLGDALYLLDYLLLSASFVCFRISNRGWLRAAEFWRDVGIVVVALVAASWADLFVPFLAPGSAHPLALLTTMLYILALNVMLATGVLVAMGSGGTRGDWTPVPLAAAALCEWVWEVAWLAGQMHGRSYVGLFYNFGDVLCFAFIATAAAVDRGASETADRRRTLETSVHGFLPMLAILVGVALLAGKATTAWGADSWIRFSLVALGAVLVLSRQHSVRREVKKLNQELALREADARVTELVRHSETLLLVVDESLRVSFVSPATAALLGQSVQALTGVNAATLFGTGNELRLAEFLERLRAGPPAESDTRGAEPAQQFEITVEAPSRVVRTLQISGTNQLGNPRIAGLTLLLTEVTAHRQLERQVIDAAARERLRLSSDIHEGLGQELSGIALLLQDAANHPDPDAAAQRRSMTAIVSHVNGTIEMARRLAEELSPLHVARGSLSSALQRLADDARARTRLDIECRLPTGGIALDEGIADHIYRIAREAINNAVRHSGCTQISIALEAEPNTIRLAVHDNGRGIGATTGSSRGFGLRIMQYRARMVSGTLRIDAPPAGGTRMMLTVPRPALTDSGRQAAMHPMR